MDHQANDKHLADLSKDSLIHLATERFPGHQAIEYSNGAGLLFDLLSWHASFPFPVSETGSATPCIDEAAFLRAICLLTRDPPPYHAPKFSSAQHGTYSGKWGPHRGWFIAMRGKDATDFNRRLFRSLAVPNVTSANHETTIPVPRFIMYQRHPDQQESDDPEQEVIVVENESERWMDIQDVLSECPPEVDGVTANPLRESYALALPSIHPQHDDLADLHVPASRLVVFLKLLHALHTSEERGEQDVMEELIASTEALGYEELSWEWFGTTMLPRGVSI